MWYSASFLLSQTQRNSLIAANKYFEVNNMLKALRQTEKVFGPRHIQKRSFWEYVNMMFNKPDTERIKKFGADRSCAEWILKNSGKIVWENGDTINDYNSLPTEGRTVPKIKEIDGSDSGISHYGFPHLIGCKVKKIILHNARYINDEAMKGLQYTKDSLIHLQVSECPNVTDAGLKELKDLHKLETLVLFKLPSVDNLGVCKQLLHESLPNCKIQGAADGSTETTITK